MLQQLSFPNGKSEMGNAKHPVGYNEQYHQANVPYFD